MFSYYPAAIEATSGGENSYLMSLLNLPFLTIKLKEYLGGYYDRRAIETAYWRTNEVKNKKKKS